MNTPLRRVLMETLAWCVDDHTWISATEGSVEELFGAQERERVRVLTAASVAGLAFSGLIEVGLPAPGFQTFSAETLSPEALERRIYDEWDALPSPSQVAIWMNATPLGHEVYQENVSDEPLDRAVAWATQAAGARGVMVPTGDHSTGQEEAELPNVRYLEDGPEQAEAYHERLRGGGVEVTPPGFDPEGAITRLEDATFIVWRRHSPDGTPALEFDIPSRGKVKLRYLG